MSHRHHTWYDIADLNENLTVFLKLDEALERFLEDFAFSSHEPYKISTDSGTLERPSRAQISAAADSLGGSPTGFEVWYLGPDRSRSVDLAVVPFSAFPVQRIGCTLQVFGDDENETNGRFDTLRNRLEAEIKRLWPKATAAAHVTAASPVATPPATLPGRNGFWQRAGAVLRHPTGATIVGTLVAAGVLALIGVLWKLYFG
jgi:tetrahydromethanopterin S-methyltransferase subunit B